MFSKPSDLADQEGNLKALEPERTTPRHDGIPVPAHHTRAVLREFGCDATLIDAMLADGAAREASEMRASRSESQTPKSHRAAPAGG